MAVEKFILKGTNSQLLKEKNILLSFVSSHLEIIDLKNIKKISILESSFMSNDFDNIDKNKSLKKNTSDSDNSIKRSDQVVSTDENRSQNQKNDITVRDFFSYSCLENQSSKKLLNDLKKYGVPQKYIDHLFWLKYNSKNEYGKYKSFYNLILEVYFPREYHEYKIQTVILDLNCKQS
jgi:hypothetical protein